MTYSAKKHYIHSGSAPYLATNKLIFSHWQDALKQAQSPLGQTAFRFINTNPPKEIKPSTATPLALQGWQVSVKDLFDIQGQISAAGSLIFENNPPATQNAVAVQRLISAGAHIIGRSHMVEFAFSGLGPNPHFPPMYAVDAYHGTAQQPWRTLESNFVSGGSSSGAALSVALGAADIGLGSDTGGSIRIPAAFNGLVGFKSSRQLVPTQGTVPLSSSLDTVCAITRNVEQAIIVHNVLANRTAIRSPAPLQSWRLAVVRNYFFENADEATKIAFSRSLQLLRAQGAKIEEIDLLPLEEIASARQQWGTLPAAESYAWHKALLEKQRNLYDPRVRQRIENGAKMSATDYLQLQAWRLQWQKRLINALSPYDAILSPTVAITAPHFHEVSPDPKNDARFSELNTLVLRNTSAINWLDGCAISIPCHAIHEKPVGLMLWHTNGHDDAILNIANLAEGVLQKALIAAPEIH